MYLQKFEVKNKTALVTGAGKGIGKASAIALAEAGADLIILSRTKEDLNKVKLQINNLKRKCKIFVCDVSNYEDIKTVFKQINSLDILVNNAGTNRPDHLLKLKKKIWIVVDLNIKAAFHVAQMATKVMLKSKNRKNKGGSIINISSQLQSWCYNMTKFGIEGLTRGMSLDLAKNNIRVNTIFPNFVETPMFKNIFKVNKFKKAMMDNIPLGRFASDSDIATAVVYLASNASSMVTGSSLVIDGGWTAK